MRITDNKKGTTGMLGKILLVDDDPNLLASFKRQLRGAYEVHTASCGQRALDKIRQDGPFAVVVSDQCMPGMSGIELFRRLRDLGDPTARIMLTGLGDQGVAMAALNEGRIFRFHNKSSSDVDLRRSIDEGIAHFCDEVARRDRLRGDTIRAEKLQTPESQQMRAHLAGALQREEFALVFQPQIAIASGQLVGLEALMRWNSPSLGAVSPEHFVPLLEEMDLIAPVGRWVMQRACGQLRSLLDQGFGALRMAVNVSPLQLKQGGLIETVAETLHASNVNAADVELELTESTSLETDPVTIRRMTDLRSFGVSLAVDDFGIGYSTFSYLTRFPINRLKIDKSLMRDLVAGKQDRTVTHAIIDLGHRLGLSVTVEGMEGADQLEIVRQLGGDEGQGFLFGRAMAGPALTEFLRQRASGNAMARWDSSNGGALAAPSYGYDI